ncbi:MAG: EpsI family protein [Acidobacteriales bacterium]|nr:EpsI family protein [Terriglobales bacterium]
MPIETRTSGKRQVVILTCLFALQALAFYSLPTAVDAPQTPPLATFPDQIGQWMLTGDERVQDAVLQVLQPDDYMLRRYVEARTGERVELFVTYYRQRSASRAPHSPKTCLIGAGWDPKSREKIWIDFPDLAAKIRVNQYVVRKGIEQRTVLYWFQTGNRVTADEYTVRFHSMGDIVRLRRSDSSLVRIIVPVMAAEEERRSQETAARFARALYPRLCQWFPPL